MRWTMGRRSDNVEDRRGSGPGMPLVAGGGIGSIILVLVALYFGIDPSVVLQGGGQPAPTTAGAGGVLPGRRRRSSSSSRSCSPTPKIPGGELFRGMNREYRDPTLVLFSGSVQSACGMAGAAVGPFYCPGDHKLYLDTSFFRDLRDRFGAPGDFAQAYVIAHEVGHHVQTLLGISERVQNVRRRSDTSARPTRCRSGWSCRPTASPASGPTTPTRPATSSKKATSTKPSAPPPPSATTACRRQRRGSRRSRQLHPRLLRTARPLVPPRLRRPAKSASATPSPPAALNSS